MPELEDQLTGLAAEIEWPATPQLRVVISLPTRRGAPVWWRPLALAAAAVIVAATALLAFPPSRNAIASWINLHVNIQRVQSNPTPSSHPPGQLGSQLGLGTPTTLQSAQAKVSWHITVPSALGAPDGVYYLAPPDGPSEGEVSLVYASRQGINPNAQTGVGVLVTEARGQVQQEFFAKMLGPDATLEQVSIGGHQGYWISGKPHEFFFLDAAGNFRSETLRLATNTLIFDENGTIIRIEGDLTQAQALQIAESMA